MASYRTQRSKNVFFLLITWIFLFSPVPIHAATLWTASDTPSIPADTDGQEIELGVKFQADVNGSITALRFYKGATNTGLHVAKLWTGAGVLLASADFVGETASGWQEVQFSAPVAIQAGTTYVASYHSSSGYFALTESYFLAERYTPPLRALASGAGGGNGVYRYGASGFPTATWNANNYWVDIVFNPSTTDDTTPPEVTAFSVPATADSLTVSITSFTATDNVGVTGYLVSESSTAPSPTSVGWSATAQTSYSFATAGSKTLYAWAKDAVGNVSDSRNVAVTVTAQSTNPEPAGWYAGDMHVHRSCGGSPLGLDTIYANMAAQNLKAISLLADAGNGEVLDPVIDLPKVNGEDDPISTAERTIHWDAEWHWDPNYFQFPHQALGGHVVTLGLTEAHQIWEEYTYPIFQWAHQQNGIAGFAHMQALDDSIPQDLNCCKPIEYPVEIALGAADFISEDVEGSDSFINAYYRLLNTGFRPGFAAGSDFPCAAETGSSLTYVRTAGGQFTYRSWIEGIAQGRTVISRNGHDEFLELTVNGTAKPGDEINLTGGGSVSVAIQWTANQNLNGTVELVQNGVVVASEHMPVKPGVPGSLNTTVNFAKSGWLAARRMGTNGHQVHTAAVFVTIDNGPVRASVADAEFYVQWIDNLLAKTSPGGEWNSYFPNDLAAAQSRYQQAKNIFRQRADEAGGGDPSPGGFTIWNQTSIPSQPAVNDGSPIEVGVKFQADVAGSITALRFYKGAANTGTHVGHLWSRTGTLLATATFTGETASGWQEVQLATPVAIQAGTTYVASYHSSSGYFALDEGYFTTDVYNPPLRALATGVDGGNGVFKYGDSGFPTETWNGNGYSVDVVFRLNGTGDTTPPAVTSFTVPAEADSLTVPITAFTATDDVGVTGYLVNESSAAPAATAGGWSATPQTSYTFATAGSKTLYAWAKDAAGNVSASAAASVTVTLTGPVSYSIWNSDWVPSQAAVNDGSPIEVGVKFKADNNGNITALRFYKGAANTGTHVGHLWTGTGTLLATATFTAETASGWQEVQLTAPVAIQAGTTYVASYHSSSGYFALNEGYFTTEVYTPPLRALASGADGGNGVYKYGESGFPTETWNANGYSIDVVFKP